MVCKQNFNTCSGNLDLPLITDLPIGNHTVICCGYDDTTKRIKIQNSWGTKWGSKGYCYMSYEYLESGLCDEAYIIVDGNGDSTMESKPRKFWDRSSSYISRLYDYCMPFSTND
jgi:C1A family cysteine protease